MVWVWFWFGSGVLQSLHDDSRFPLQKHPNVDCALVSKKTVTSGSPPICAVSFEGSDDSLEPIEPAYKMGTILINGFEVWRGVAREYLGAGTG